MHRKLLVLATLLGGVGVAAGIALATIPDSSGVVHACYARSGGALRVIDAGVTNCKSSETSLDWNLTGAPGPAGPAGAAGAAGPAGSEGPEGPRGPSSAQSLSAPLVELNGNTTIATMSVGAGAYAIEAKTVLADDNAENVYVFCTLDAANPADEDTSAAMVGLGSARQTVSLQLTHTFASPGTIRLSCQPTRPADTTNVGSELTKITAIEVETETH